MQSAIRFSSWAAFLLLLYASPLAAQLPGLGVYRMEDNNARIFSIFKSSDGYIYTGTNAGLFKFDGKRFKIIPPGNTRITDTITAVFRTRSGELWTGYQSGALAHSVNGILTYIDPEEGLPKKRITVFLEDKTGRVWFGTNGEGIYFIDKQRLYLVNDQNGLSDLHIHSMAMADNGDIIAATDQGINICRNNGTRTAVSVIAPSKGLPDYIVTAIAPAGNNSFWIAMQDKGFCLYNHSNGQITIPSCTGEWSMGQVNAINYAYGNLWLATQDSGLVKFVAAQNLLSVQALNYQQRKIAGNIVTDDQANLWMISDNNTLLRLSGNSIEMHPVYNTDFAFSVHTILVDHLQQYWAGTDMAVVRFAFDGRQYISKRYPVPGLDIKTDITSLYEDSYHNIWIGTMGSGIYLLDPLSGKTKQLKEATAGNSILSITGSGNTICAGSLEGAIVFELDSTNASINNPYHFTVHNNIETIGSTYIYSVFKDSRKRLWFATDGKGLTVLNNGVATHYNESNGIRDGHIYSVTEDKAGKIWFSTSNTGIYCYDGSAFKNFSVKEGLSSLSVSSLKTDGEGNIVVVHKNGLDIIHPVTGNFSYINAAHGITEVIDDLGASCTDAMGNIYVATAKGILRYTDLKGILPGPKTVIEDVQLFLNNIDTAGKHLFSYDENNITFNFTGLYYSDPESVYYEFKLDGLDSAWQITTDNVKSFPKLPPGKYTFRVRSSLSKNFSNTSEAAFAFEITRPFWKTWWFIIAAFSVFAGLLSWFVKRREQHLTHMERLRAEKIKFEFEVLRNQVNPHFLFNSFNTLISTIEDNPRSAVEYVEQLSDFFRNIVNYRNRDLISLSEELSLLQNYMFLQQKRYGNSLQLSINVSAEEQEQIFMPPLTLQLLTENAIKHNVVSKEAILQIEIFTADRYIVVQNNINKKLHAEKGTGMGLQNIINRYALLGHRSVQVKDTGDAFIVHLPFLKQH